MPFRALLCEFDGVIADTENIRIVAWERTFGAMGWAVDPEVCARAAQVDDDTFLKDVFARRQIHDGDIKGWVSRKQRLAVAMLADSPRVYPGMPELFRGLQGRVRLGIVSTSWRQNIVTVLQAVGLEDVFDVIVGKEDVKMVKPSAAGYKLALRRLQLTKRDAVALEESPMGHLSAQLAGLRVCVVGHGKPPAGWVGHAFYLSDFSDTRKVIRTLQMMAPVR
ncbi:MAG TPA: HAD family phosphatase [Isosphaeraceae bacterium]|jgi:putative hydrolase of the HAD superfamily|nr:HAD family phosphatase [Isosphaeraceae bacterium]